VSSSPLFATGGVTHRIERRDWTLRRERPSNEIKDLLRRASVEPDERLSTHPALRAHTAAAGKAAPLWPLVRRLSRVACPVSMASDQRLAFTDDPHRIQGNGGKGKDVGSSSKQNVQQEDGQNAACCHRLMLQE